MSASAGLSLCTSCQKLNRVDLARAQSRQPVCGNCHSALPLHHGINELSGSELGALIAKSPVPVVADFWAPWCGPCRSFAPAYERAARELAGQYAFAKINTEQHALAADAFHIRGIPTLILFQGGVERVRQSGAMPYDAFLGWLSQSSTSAA